MGLPNRIYLTGFMGSGKSTLGPIMANVLGYDFVDLDEWIEDQAGVPVQRIFEEQGEGAFRRLEQEALQRTATRERVVVALGGGATAREDNLQFVLQHGLLVYLRVTAEQLIERLERSPTERPLLQDESGNPLPPAELAARVEAKLAERERFYRRAHLTVDVGKHQVGMTVDALVRAVKRS